MRCACILLAVLLLVGCGREQETIDSGGKVAYPQEQTWVLLSALGDDKDLVFHLVAEHETSAFGFATAHRFNSRWHTVDAAAPTVQTREGGLIRRFHVTLQPDQWVPKDGTPIDRTFSVWPESTNVYLFDDVTNPGKDSEGGSATVHRTAPPPYRHLRLRLYGALQRLVKAKGPNTHYALDMWLICDVDGNAVKNVMLESVVPDYRGYSVKVEKHDLTFEDNRLAGTVSTMVDYGGQGASKKWEDHLDRHVFTVDALAIGEACAGRYAVDVVDHLQVEDLWCQGVSENDPPPAPAESRVWLRLHDAMRKDWPVRLELSLGETIHGWAWVPRYNHQPHTVDASGLRMEDGRLRGPVIVTVVPDVYHDPDVTFDLHYSLDVAFNGRAATGSFGGRDGDLRTEGIITGETRAKRPRVADSLAGLESVTLGLGWCLGGGKAKTVNAKKIGHHAEAVVSLEDGQVEGVTLRNPKTRADLPTSAATCELVLDGDRLTGRLGFTIKGGWTFVFDLTGIVDGDRLGGYWRATRDGTALLTKSSKLGGRLVPREDP